MLNLWPLLLPAAATSGWWFATYKKQNTADCKPGRLSNEYVLGLNYLLNEQPDKAVDIFIRLLEVDDDTVETHLALGSLFRRRGEVDRAIRIHQNLIARPQLSQPQRIDALMALAKDYTSAGVFDRAERIFQEVSSLGGRCEAESLQCLLNIYQQEKAWLNAITTARQLEQISNKRMHQVLCHYYCELVDDALKEQAMDKAQTYLKQALAIDRQSVRASLLLGSLEKKNGRFKSAIKAYKRVAQQDPDYLSEIIKPLLFCYTQLGSTDECIAFLLETLKLHPRASVMFALAGFYKDSHGIEYALDFVAEQLNLHPSLKGLNHLIAWHVDTSHGKVRNKLTMLCDITAKLIDNKPVYRCGVCGFGGKHLHWQCPSCKQWGTVKPIHGLEGD